MKLTLVLFVFAFVVTSPAIAQCPGIPPCWPQNAESVTCTYNGYTACQNPNTEYCQLRGLGTKESDFDVTYYDPDLGQFDSCVTELYICDSGCPVGYNAASVRRSQPKPPVWQFDPVRFVLGLFPRVTLGWKTSPHDGRCVRTLIKSRV